MSDDLRPQLQAMARWADARHEPIDPDQARARRPRNDPPAEPRELTGAPSPTPPSDRRHRIVLVAAIVIVLVAVSGAVLLARPGQDLTVDIPAHEPDTTSDGSGPVERSPGGWVPGATFPAEATETSSVNQNAVATWTGADVLVANGLAITGPMPYLTLLGDDGPVGTVPGPADSVQGRFGATPAYDPVRRSWRLLAEPGLDITDDGSPSVWTGTEYIVAGRPEGAGCSGLAGDTPPTTLVCGPDGSFAAALDPVAGTWRRLADPPTEIEQSQVVWTGDTAVYIGAVTVTTYVPATDTWRVVVPYPPAANPSTPKYDAAVWDGRELILVDTMDASGGISPSTPQAFAMDVTTGTGRAIASPPIQTAQLVWTGTEVLGLATDGSIAAWDPGSDTWTLGAPSPLGARSVSVGGAGGLVTWTGDRLVVWGGRAVHDPDSFDPGPSALTDGAIYDPAADTWTPIPAIDVTSRVAVAGLTWHTAVWADDRLVVIGTSRDGFEAVTWSPT